MRLGDCNAQTRWVLERSGAAEPAVPAARHAPRLRRDADELSDRARERADPRGRARDGARRASSSSRSSTTTARSSGVVTERALARRYIRESRADLDAPGRADARLSAIVDVLEGELLTGEDTAAVGPRLGPVDGRAAPQRDLRRRRGRGRQPGRRAAAGDRAGRGADRRSRTTRAPTDEVLELARERGTAVIVSPLDSYVSGRMITLAAPCSALMERDPLTVTTEYLVADISEQIKEIHYGAAVVIDAQRRPVGLVTRSRSGLAAAPARAARRPRRAGAERRRHRAGRDRRDPRPPPHRLDRDPGPRHRDVRSGRLDGDARGRALPSERHGAEPADGDDAARRGPVGHGDPQLRRPRPSATTPSSTTSSACSRSTPPSSAARCSRRPPTSPRSAPRRSSRATPSSTTSSSGHTICIAQIEVVGKSLLERKRGAARGDAQGAREQGAPALRADGHRRAEQGHRAARRGRHGDRGAGVRRRSRTTA